MGSLVQVRRNEVLVLNYISRNIRLLLVLLIESNLRFALNLITLVESQRSSTSLVLSQIDRVRVHKLIHFRGFQNISTLVFIAKSWCISSQWSVWASLVIIDWGHILQARVIPLGILIYLLVRLKMSWCPWSSRVWSHRILIWGYKTGIGRICRQYRRLLSLKS